MKITGRTILITGGSAGIGLAFALKFLELGNQVIVTGRRQTVLDEVKAKYPKLHTIQGDVADAAQIASLATRVKAEYPRLDVLMNNAGIMLHKNLKVPATDLDGLMAEMNINVGGVIRMTSAFIDILAANKGTVINVSSALAFVPLPSAPIYCATKAAVHSYTPIAPVAVGGDWRRGDRSHAPSGEDRPLGRHCRRRRHRFNNDRRVGEAILCVTQEGGPGDSAGSGQTTRVDAPPGTRFHQPAALESIEEASSSRIGIRHEGIHRRSLWKQGLRAGRNAGPGIAGG